jgi:hypothetical protein
MQERHPELGCLENYVTPSAPQAAVVVGVETQEFLLSRTAMEQLAEEEVVVVAVSDQTCRFLFL